MITVLSLLLVASSAMEVRKEGVVSEQTRKHMAPAAGLACLIYSKDRQDIKLKLPDNVGEQVSAFAGDVKSKNLFLLEQLDNGNYVLRDPHNRNKVRCVGSGDDDTQVPMMSPDSAISTDQQWIFEAKDGGFYEILNVGNPQRALGVKKDKDWAGCWARGGEGSETKYWQWRFEDIFESKAMWTVTQKFPNNADQEVIFEYKKMVGYTQSIESSEAHTSTISQSLTFGVSGAFKALGLTAEETTSYTNEFQNSVSTALSGTFATETTVTMKVQPKTCLQLVQLQVSQDDTLTDTHPNLDFYSSTISAENCPDWKPSASSDSYTLLHSGGECGSGDTDLGSKSTVQECAEAVLGSGGTWFIYGTGAKAGKCFKESTTSDSCPEAFETDEYDFYRANADDEALAMSMATSESTGPHWAVKVLAVVGFAASVYGAVCHFTGPKEEVTL
jgi:hypothetical protein